MTHLQTIIDTLSQEVKHSQMYLRFETNNRNYDKATGWLAQEIKFLTMIDLLKENQDDNIGNENASKLNLVRKGLQSELLICRDNINLAVQNQKHENFASLRDAEKKFEELLKLMEEVKCEK